MAKRMQKIGASCALLAICVALCGCGQEAPEASATPEAPTQAAQETPEATPQPSASAADDETRAQALQDAAQNVAHYLYEELEPKVEPYSGKAQDKLTLEGKTYFAYTVRDGGDGTDLGYVAVSDEGTENYFKGVDDTEFKKVY